MSDKEKYEKLKEKMIEFVKYLNNCYDSLESAYNNSDGLKINDSIYLKENYKKLKEVALNEDVSIQYPELYKSENLSVLGHSHDLLKMYLHRLVHEIHSKDLW